MFLMSEVLLYPGEEMVVEGARACPHYQGKYPLECGEYYAHP